MKHKVAIGVAVVAAGALAYYFLRPHVGALVCRGTFTRMTLDEAKAQFGTYSSWPQIAQQVQRYGGTCVGGGSADFAGVVDDSGLITQPWQV